VGALTLEAARPSFFFRKATDEDTTDDSARARRRRRDPERDLLPERARLAITKPPQFAGMSDEAFRAELAERVAGRVSEIHAQRAKEGHRGWLGAAAVRLQHWSDHPGVQSPTGSLNPRIACKDKWRRIELLNQQVGFWQEYQEARVRYQAGERNVVFPEGTYWFKVHFRVRCRGAA
jgi:hypothetical protein